MCILLLWSTNWASTSASATLYTCFSIDNVLSFAFCDSANWASINTSATRYALICNLISHCIYLLNFIHHQ